MKELTLEEIFFYVACVLIYALAIGGFLFIFIEGFIWLSTDISEHIRMVPSPDM